MPRLVWVFARRTATLLILSYGSSYYHISPLASVKCPGHIEKSEWFRICFSFMYFHSCCNDFRWVWSNRIEPDQTAPERANIRGVYTFCHSVCTFSTHYLMVKPRCSIFRIMTAILSVVPNFFYFYGISISFSLLQVSIAMPQLKLLKNVVDKMKNLSNCLVSLLNFLQCFELGCLCLTTLDAYVWHALLKTIIKLLYLSHVIRKPVYTIMWTTKVWISLRIYIVWSAPLLSAA